MGWRTWRELDFVLYSIELGCHARGGDYLDPMPPPDLSAPRRARIDALADDIAVLSASIDAATHQLLTAIREFDAERGWALQGAKSMATWLSWRTGCHPHTARERVRTANALGQLPKMDATFGDGAISYSKVRAMTRVATPDNEDLLLHQAKTATASQLERVCASFRSVQKKIDPEMADDLTDEDHRHVRRRIQRDGTVILEVRVLPDEADTIMKAIRATKAALEAERARDADGNVPAGTRAVDGAAGGNVPAGTGSSRHSEGLSDGNVPAGTRAVDGDADGNVPAGTRPTVSLPDALVAIAHGQLAALENQTPAAGTARTPSAKNRELLLHLRTSDLVKGAFVAELHDGTPLDGATFCRLACDTGVVVAHTDDDGDPLDVGRRRRTIPSAIMRALLIRDRGCAFPGCNHQAFVEAHHLEHWSNGGDTAKDNLVCLCHPHHVALHEGGFTAARREDGTLLFRDPTGRPIPAHPEPLAPQPTPTIDDPKTNLIDWDGRPMDLHGAVSALVNRQLGCVH